MFFKTASPSDWDTMSEENQARLVKVSRYGLMPNDAANLSKFAGDQFVDAVKKIEGSLRKDCEYVHAVSCGASEFYGPNRNGDGWKADVLDRDMCTYLKHAKLFRDHINKKDSPYYGRVKVAFFDRERGYGRTLAEYNATKTAADELGGLVAERELEKLAKNGFIAVSHGTSVGQDFCAHCGNIAKKRAEYCLSKEEGGSCTLFGCRNGMRKVAEDGRVQYTDNPKNIFYDLSDVESPADRIAYGVLMSGLHKSASVIVDYIELPPRYDLAAVDMQSSFGNRLMKAAVRLAELENQVNVNDLDMNKMASLTAIAGDPSVSISIAGLVDRDPYVKRGTAYTLATRKECPSAGQMAKAAGFGQRDAVLCDEISRGVLDNLFRQGKIASLLENSDFLSRPLSPSSHYRAVGASAPGYSIDAKSLTKRSHTVAFTGDKLDIGSVSKEANPSPALVQIACDHVAMKIAMAAQFFQDDEKMLMLLASPRRT